MDDIFMVEKKDHPSNLFPGNELISELPLDRRKKYLGPDFIVMQ